MVLFVAENAQLCLTIFDIYYTFSRVKQRLRDIDSNDQYSSDLFHKQQ